MKAFAITGLKETGFVEKDERPVGAGEVCIRVDYVGFCGSDLNTYRGLNPLVKLPRVPGHEISATIAEIGAGVPDAWKVGQRVAVSPYTNCGMCTSCLKGRPNCCRYNETLGVQRDGAMQPSVVVPWTKLYDASGLSAEHVALVEPLTVGGHAADRSGAMEDDIAVVIGCGAVGLGAVLGLARKNARRVIAVDVDDEKLALAKELGATDAVNSAKTDLHSALEEMTEGAGRIRDEALRPEGAGHPRQPQRDAAELPPRDRLRAPRTLPHRQDADEGLRLRRRGAGTCGLERRAREGLPFPRQGFVRRTW